MKIWVQLSAQRPEDKREPQAYLDAIGKVKRPDTELFFYPVPPGRGISSLGGFGYLGIRFFNDPEILRNLRRAEAEGFDAAIICSYLQLSALRAARQLLTVPVVGLAESSMLMANLMGLRFSVVTSDHRFLDEITETIGASGMAARAITNRPARAINLNEETFVGCLGGNSQNLVDDFTRVAMGCIEDGAHVIIVGCGLMSRALTQAGLFQIAGVPIVDPILASIKVAEMMADWRQGGFPTVSRRGLFEQIPAQVFEEARASGLL